MENRLMTIVFIDMQGYTKRSATQTIEEMKLFHDQMFKFVADIMQKWNGIMVKSLGDGFMVRFDSPTNAVQAGIELQRRLEARNAQMLNPDSIVRFRVGINSGEVGIDESGDLFGDPVNIASRIQTFADTNDVFISESTYLAMNRNEFGAVDLGNQDLKNATREIKIYKVLKNGAPGITLPGPKTAKQQPEPAAGGVFDKKILAGMGIAAFIFAVLLAGFFIGRRGGAPAVTPAAPVVTTAVEVKPDKPAVVTAPATPPETLAMPVQPQQQQPGNRPSPPAQNGQTILETDPQHPGIPFDHFERQVLSDVQQMAAAGRYGEAERRGAEMVYRVPEVKKFVWALVVAELMWKQNKKQDAEKIFANINASEKLKPEGRKKIGEHISRIKSR